jgi:hypothetical protein
MGIASLQIITSTLSRQHSPLTERGEAISIAVIFRDPMTLQDKFGQCIAS